MTPIVGDTVLFTFDKGRRDLIDAHQAAALRELGQGTTVPAIIVSVWDADLVNLRVHPDGPGPDLWETSVQRKGENTGDGSSWEYPPNVVT